MHLSTGSFQKFFLCVTFDNQMPFVSVFIYFIHNAAQIYKERSTFCIKSPILLARVKLFSQVDDPDSRVAKNAYGKMFLQKDEECEYTFRLFSTVCGWSLFRSPPPPPPARILFKLLNF
jgi:hypothetical protein